jgi:hypothetical protein
VSLYLDPALRAPSRSLLSGSYAAAGIRASTCAPGERVARTTRRHSQRRKKPGATAGFLLASNVRMVACRRIKSDLGKDRTRALPERALKRLHKHVVKHLAVVHRTV